MGWLSNNGAPQSVFEVGFTTPGVTAVRVTNVLNASQATLSLLGLGRRRRTN